MTLYVGEPQVTHMEINLFADGLLFMSCCVQVLFIHKNSIHDINERPGRASESQPPAITLCSYCFFLWQVKTLNY